MDFGIAGIASISVLCYVVAQIAKATSIENKWLPVICGLLGCALGVVGLYVMPEFPADDVLSAAAVGAVSGLAATGVNQVYKQLSQKDQ